MVNREDWIMSKEVRSRGCHLKDIPQGLGCCGKTVSRAHKCWGRAPFRTSGVRKVLTQGQAGRFQPNDVMRFTLLRT